MPSKAKSPNPKDLFGAKKPSMSLIPTAAAVACALALQEGALKYGAYNWRSKDVLCSIYVDALIRHARKYYERQQSDPLTRVHHLGNVMACAAILIDAEATGCLIDDRPEIGADVDAIFAHAEEVIVHLRKTFADGPPKAGDGDPGHDGALRGSDLPIWPPLRTGAPKPGSVLWAEPDELYPEPAAPAPDTRGEKPLGRPVSGAADLQEPGAAAAPGGQGPVVDDAELPPYGRGGGRGGIDRLRRQLGLPPIPPDSDCI